MPPCHSNCISVESIPASFAWRCNASCTVISVNGWNRGALRRLIGCALAGGCRAMRPAPHWRRRHGSAGRCRPCGWRRPRSWCAITCSARRRDPSAPGCHALTPPATHMAPAIKIRVASMLRGQPPAGIMSPSHAACPKGFTFGGCPEARHVAGGLRVGLAAVPLRGVAQVGEPCVCRLARTLERLPSLSTLSLARNGLEELPDALWAAAGLRHLDLSHNRLQRLPGERPPALRSATRSIAPPLMRLSPGRAPPRAPLNPAHARLLPGRGSGAAAGPGEPRPAPQPARAAAAAGGERVSSALPGRVSLTS